MKKVLFGLGVLLLYISVGGLRDYSLSNNTIIVFGFLLLLAFFDELEEFNFLGLKGKKIDKELKDLLKNIDRSQDATQPDDDLTKLRKKTIQLMSVDRGNFLALVFEIERLLRYVASLYYPDEVIDSTTLLRVVSLLRGKGYLTETGAEQVKGLHNVRNLLAHGRVGVEEDNKLVEWTELAYKLYAEIVSDLTEKKSTN